LEDHVVYGQKHLRGGALNCALLDALPDIAFGKCNVEALLSKADEYLEKLTTNNLASIARLALEAGEHGEEMRRFVLSGYPTPLVQLVQAGLKFRASVTGMANSVAMTALEEFRLNKDESYWSITVNHCLEIKLERYAETLETYFGMRIDREQRLLIFV
jgi:hypothetical protein